MIIYEKTLNSRQVPTGIKIVIFPCLYGIRFTVRWDAGLMLLCSGPYGKSLVW